MKKYIPMLFITVFPYAVLATLYLLFSSTLGKWIFAVLGVLVVWWIVSFILSIFSSLTVISGRYPAKSAALVSMIIKLVQIPAYIGIFITGIILAVSVFTYAIALILIFVDAAVILCTGMFGAVSVIRSCNEGILTKKQAILYSVMQFLYCFDVIFAVILYIKTIKRPIPSE